MRKHFWKIEYSITLICLLAIFLMLVPTRLIASKEAAYISKWNDVYKKMEYVFNAMLAQADDNILKGFHNAKSDEEKEDLMMTLVKPYLRVNMTSDVKSYPTYYMNGEQVKESEYAYFSNLYKTNDNMILGIKDVYEKQNYKPAFILMFDVNGKIGPNTWGKDIYAINIFKDGKISPMGQGLGINEVKQDCSENGKGLSCSYYYRIGGEFNE